MPAFRPPAGRRSPSSTTPRRFLRSLPGPYVVKTDGLAAGKGVLVTDDLDEAERDVAAKLSGAAFGEAGRRVVIEEALQGTELSLLVVCDGDARLGAARPPRTTSASATGDTGPNTGGMGAFSPVPNATAATVDGRHGPHRRADAECAQASRDRLSGRALRRADADRRGAKLIEYNVRFGDPEAEVVLPRLATDLTDLLAAAAAGSAGSAGLAGSGSGCRPLRRRGRRGGGDREQRLPRGAAHGRSHRGAGRCR